MEKMEFKELTFSEKYELEMEKRFAEFMKKEDKFKILYKRIIHLEDKVGDLENEAGSCSCDCSHDEEKEWIEKIKFEQEIFNERLDTISDDVNGLEEKIDDILEILTNEIDVLEKKINKWQERF